MRKLFEAMQDCLNRGEPCVMSTIIADSGSTPRGAGARMLTLPDGRHLGTIGGGAVEFRAQGIAAELLETGRSTVRAFVLNRSDVEGLGMICGGDVRVYFQYIPGGDAVMAPLCAQVLEALCENQDMWLVTDITDETVWSMALCRGEADDPIALPGPLPHQARQLDAGGRRYYVEPLVRAGMVWVFGGGHVARALVPVLAGVDFRCAVFEDREDFARIEDFPGAVRMLLGDFSDIGARLQIRPEDYVVVMTRGHAHDYEVQVQALRAGPRYLGVIGSKNKVAALAEKMRAEGFTDREIASVHSPIGIEIGSETPAEIAISVAAELIQVRAAARSE